MQNKNWRRIALILSIMMAGTIIFGAGYAIGVYDTSKFVVNIAYKFAQYQNITLGKAELMEYFIKLKGG